MSLSTTVLSKLMRDLFSISVYSVRNVAKMDDWQELLSEQGKLIVVKFYATW